MTATQPAGGDRVALVTGGSFGVGAACIRALARDGWRIAATATRVDNLSSIGGEMAQAGHQILPLALDLKSQDQAEACVAQVLKVYGRLDCLINNAGVNLRRDAVDVSSAQWDDVMDTNLKGTFFLTQAVGRVMIGHGTGGSVVMISSSHGLVGAAQRSTYGISKAGLIQMARMLAIEWGAHNIRVNALAPGRMETESPSRASTGGDPAYMAAMLQKIPLRRLATPEEVGDLAAFLAGPSGASITGQVIALDGGLTAA